MIGPTTRLFGLVTVDADDGWLARLYNYLFGFNSLDAAYGTFVVKPAALETLLDGLAARPKTELAHVAPSCWERAAAWTKQPGPVDTLSIAGGALTPSLAHPRFLALHLEAQLGRGFTAGVLGLTATVLPLLDALAPLSPTLTFAGQPPADAAALVVAARARSIPATAHAGALDLGAVDVLLDAALPGQASPVGLAGAPRKAVVAACSWNLTPPRTRQYPASVPTWPSPRLWLPRALEELRERFGVDAEVPDDLDAALTEKTFRPCKMTHDDFKERHAARRPRR